MVSQYDSQTDLERISSYVAADPSRQGRSNNSSYECVPQFRSFFEQVIGRNIPTPLNAVSELMASRLENYLVSAAQEKPLTLKEADAQFDHWYMPRLLKESYGNLSKAGELAGVDRRTLYRRLDEYKGDDRFDPDLYRPTKEKRQMQEEVLQQSHNPQYFKPDIVDRVLTSSLESFREVLHPSLYSKLEKTIDENTSRITQELNNHSYGIGRVEQACALLSSISSLNYEQAHGAFEKKVIYATLAEAGFDIKKAAKYLDVSEKTLQRKIEKHGIDLELRVHHEKERAKEQEDPVWQPQRQGPAIKGAQSEAARLRELMVAYQRRIDERCGHSRRPSERRVAQDHSSTVL